jgi:hypothetical protein
MHARKLSDELLLAHWNLPSTHHHKENAEIHFMALLSNGHDLKNKRKEVLAVIADEIVGELFSKAQAADCAEAILNALIKKVVP